VRGGATAAEVVVVHRREVIVYQRVGVHEFDRAGRGEGGLHFAATRFGGGESENGAKAFAAGEDRVAHALVDGAGASGDSREKAVEGVVDKDLSLFEIIFEIRHGREPSGIFGEGKPLIAVGGKGVSIAQ